MSDRRLEARFSQGAMAAFAWNTVNSWMVVGATMTVPLLCGGLLYPTIAAAAIMSIVCLGCAELASAFPSAGNQFWIVYEVFPPSCRRASAYLTGWMTVYYFMSAIASCGFFTANVILQLVSLWHPEYTPSRYHAQLVHILLCSFAFILAARFPSSIAKMGYFTVGLSLSGFIISIVFVYSSIGVSGHTRLQNSSGWPDGWAMILAITSSLSAFSGFDAPAHLSEEVQNPHRKVPRAMGAAGLGTVLLSLYWAFTLNIARMDFKAVVEADMPILEVYWQASKSIRHPKALVTFWGVLYVVIFFHMILNLFMSSGRAMWSFSRWGGFPHPFCSKLNWGSPLRATGAMLALQLPTVLAYLSPVITHTTMSNVAMFFLNLTLALPQAVLLLRGRGCLPASQFSLGKLGYVVNAGSTLLVVFFSVAMLFPPSLPVTAGSTAFIIVSVGVFFIFIPAYWYVGGKQSFKQPVVRSGGHMYELV